MKTTLFVIAICAVIGVGWWYFASNADYPAPKQEQVSQDTPTETKQITAQSVAAHSTKDSCWMIISGKVYDATPAIADHEGGDVILEGCGKDATEMFNNRPGEGTPHPAQVQGMLEKLYIGDLASS